MNFPSKLNLLKGTKFAWLCPLLWALFKCAAISAPTTVEVFLHHEFGARSGKALLKGFLLLIFVSAISNLAAPLTTVNLSQYLTVAYVGAAIGHWVASQNRTGGEHVHSYSHGKPWSIWRKVPVSTATVQQYLEPAICCIIAHILSGLDPVFAYWLFFSGMALFVKEQVVRAQLRTRRLDLLDNRIEAQQIAPRNRPEVDPFVEARSVPPHRPVRGRQR